MAEVFCQHGLANANQVRLIIDTAAYWLLRRFQQAAPKTAALARAEFITLRLRFLKVVADIVESATRIRSVSPRLARGGKPAKMRLH